MCVCVWVCVCVCVCVCVYVCLAEWIYVKSSGCHVINDYAIVYITLFYECEIV